MPDLEFVVINHLSNPNINSNYNVPENVTKVIDIPIFGTYRYEEFYKEDKILLAKILRTTESIIIKEFLPLYKEFIYNALSEDCNPRRLAHSVVNLHKFLLKYDSRKCVSHHQSWEIFVNYLSSNPLYSHMALNEVWTAFQLLQRNIHALSVEIPKVDIIHCAMAWIPSLTAIYAKSESNCPMLVTEHGVQFKEILINYNDSVLDAPSKILWEVFAKNIVNTIYSIADEVTSVCQANLFWEESLNVNRSKIKVIYNGVDVSKFRPIQVERKDQRPTVVYVGRIDIFKDIITLIQAINYAKNEVKDIKCLIYGSSTDLQYSLKCFKKVKELQLEENVKFMGYTKDPQMAYNSGDVVAITSIIEGFPYTVIEAMACRKAVVATDVGGVRESLDCCGLIVRSLHPREIADAIVTLLKDRNLRNMYATASIKRVRETFTKEKMIDLYRKEYEHFTNSYKHRLSLAT